jgi:hypothetical protein
MIVIPPGRVRGLGVRRKPRRVVRWSRVPLHCCNLSCDGFEATDVVAMSCRNDVEALSGALRAASAVVHKRLLRTSPG